MFWWYFHTVHPSCCFIPDKRRVLRYHPDKKKARGEDVGEDEHKFFSCITRGERFLICRRWNNIIEKFGRGKSRTFSTRRLCTGVNTMYAMLMKDAYQFQMEWGGGEWGRQSNTIMVGWGSRRLWLEPSPCPPIGTPLVTDWHQTLLSLLRRKKGI